MTTRFSSLQHLQYPHHRLTLQRLLDHLPPSQECLALILVGSVARGDARDDSDIDLLLLTNDTFYAEERVSRRFGLQLDHLAESPCGGMGLEYIDLAYLIDTELRGNEPTRWMFSNAHILYSALPDLAERLQRIARYPLELQLERMMSFRSQLPMHYSYLQLAEWSDNRYLLAECSYKIVHFAGRLILAANGMLYPNRKWFWRALKRAPQKPEGFCDEVLAFLEAPSIAKAETLLERLYAYQDYPLPPEGWQQRFAQDSVRHWQRNQAPIEDW